LEVRRKRESTHLLTYSPTHTLTHPHPVPLLNAILATTSVGIACAVLSVFVIARRWAFLGEGVGHSGFGGVGLVCLLAAVIPTLRESGTYDALTFIASIAVPVLAALGMGVLSRRGMLSGDASIGVFLVACMAIGFVGQSVYRHRFNADPAVVDTLFYGQPLSLGSEFAIAAVVMSAGVVFAVLALRRELVAYCLDPLLAETSGVRVGFVHYLLIAMVALVVVIGVRIVGILLVSALLVLPGATSSLVMRRLPGTMLLSAAVGVAGAWAGIAIGWTWRFIPMGPAMVLAMFAIFLLTWGLRRLAGHRASSITMGR
jgi:ABC-type Mn2+/Zn2+ transport system permease subunit